MTKPTFNEEGSHGWVRIADVTAAGMYLDRTTQRLSKLGISLSVPLSPGDLFLSIAGSVGKPCITNIRCCIHDGFVYFPRWRGETRFLYYVFASGEPYRGLGKLGTQLNLNTDTVGAIHIGVPPIPEQAAIADYLVVRLGEVGLDYCEDGHRHRAATGVQNRAHHGGGHREDRRARIDDARKRRPTAASPAAAEGRAQARQRYNQAPDRRAERSTTPGGVE